MSLLPPFPPNTEFFSVEGLPVSLTPDYVCRAWDKPGGRRFSIDSCERNGAPVSFSKFVALVKLEGWLAISD